MLLIWVIEVRPICVDFHEFKKVLFLLILYFGTFHIMSLDPALPFLSNTEVFLFPIVAVLAIYVLNFIGYPMGLGWNASRLVAHYYFDEWA